MLGTISAFAYRHRETEKNLCRVGGALVKIKACLYVTPCLLVIRYRHGLWASRKVETVRSSVKSAITSRHGVFFSRFLFSEIIFFIFVLRDKLFHLLSVFKVDHF